MRRFNLRTAGIVAAALAATGMAIGLASGGSRPTRGDQPAVAADACLLKLSVPAGTRVLIDGRDFGYGRQFVYRPLSPGKTYVSQIDVRCEDRHAAQAVDVIAGRFVQVALLQDARPSSVEEQFSAPTEIVDLARRMNGFGLDLYSRLAAGGGNVVISPYCLETLLALVACGAEGATREQMAAVLNLSPDAVSSDGFDRLLDYYTSVAETAADRDHPAGEWLSANAVWVQQGFDVRQEFLTEARQRYHAQIGSLDFAAQSPARAAINDWVATHTRDKIRELVAPGAPADNTRLFLAGAVYFRGPWAEPFDPQATTTGPFHLATGDVAQVPMMQLEARLRWVRTARCQMLELPYADQRMSMLILLPNEAGGAPTVEQSLTAAELARWSSRLAPRDVQVTLPKFQVEFEASLAETLAAMGMQDAFTTAANFRGISDRQGLVISKLVHRCWIGVDEHGAEAAAATGIAVSPKAARMDQSVTFTADRPFVFCIRDRTTGAVLFIGRVADPRAG